MLVTDDLDKAEAFSDYFSTVFTVETNIDSINFDNVMPDNLMPEINLTEMEVGKKLSELNVNKSFGPDLVHPRVLYELRCVIVGPLTKIFNDSLHSGIIPNDWKNSNVTVIFKKGKKDCVDNYRPISLTCISCKIMESVIRDYNNVLFQCSQSFQ